MTRRSLPYAVLAAAYLAIVGVVTLGPTPWRTGSTQADYDVLSLSTWFGPDTWTRFSSPEFTANILLFVPLGLLVRLALPRATWFGAALLGGAVSVAIEVLQVWTPRVSDPRDIVANTLGALIGAVLGAVMSGVAGRARRGGPRRGDQSVGVSLRESTQRALPRQASRPQASQAQASQAQASQAPVRLPQASRQAPVRRPPASRPQGG